MFTQNVGGLDRTARIWGGLALIAAGLLLFGGFAGSGVGLAVAVIGAWAMVTGVASYCPMYQPFGISTARTSRAKVAK